MVCSWSWVLAAVVGVTEAGVAMVAGVASRVCPLKNVANESSMYLLLNVFLPPRLSCAVRLATNGTANVLDRKASTVLTVKINS